MPRGRKKKFKLNLNVRNETLRSVVAVVLITLGLVVFASYLAAFFGIESFIQDIFKQGFGLANLILTPILLIGGLLLTEKFQYKFVDVRILTGFVLLLVATSGLLHTSYTEAQTLKMAERGMGGGMLGYRVLEVLSGLLSFYGAVIVLIMAVIVAIILISDKTLDEIAAGMQVLLDSSGLTKLFKFRKKVAGEETEEFSDIEITSGLNIENNLTETYQHSIPFAEQDAPEMAENISAPEFEVLPNLAEPQEDLVEVTPIVKLAHETKITPTLPYSNKVWELPSLDLLADPPNTPVDRGDVKQRAKIIEDTLTSFGIRAKVKDIRFGPSVTQYALEAESGTKITKIANLQYDLALALASPTGSVRIEAPIPGKSLIGIEVPNNNRVLVNFKQLLTSDAMRNQKSKTTIVLGADVGGQPMVYNIAKMPHMLIAGATGSGKSVFIHNIMFSILYRATPQECKFILIDPKRVELVHYNGIPHLLAPVVTDIEKAPAVFKWAVQEMMRRYELLEAAKVRNIDAYNEKSGFQAMPYIIIIVDELAEIMVTDPAAVEKSIIRLAQLARATGIHLVLAIQRPSANIITGLIKANIPSRIAFNVTSQVDSRVIIDQPGAEKLLGKGDMLFVPPDESKPTRVQGAFINDKEIANLVNYLKDSGVEPEYVEEIFDIQDNTSKSITAGGDALDPLFDEALDIVATEGKASASLLQRRLSIGYSRAARILDELEAKGYIGPAKGSKPREILTQN